MLRVIVFTSLTAFSGAQALAANKVKSNSGKPSKTECYPGEELSESIAKQPVLSAMMQRRGANKLLVKKECLTDPTTGLAKKYFLQSLQKCAPDGSAVEPCSLGKLSTAYVNLVERSISTALFCMRSMFAQQDGSNRMTTAVTGRKTYLPSKEKATAYARRDRAPVNFNEEHGLKAELLLGMLSVESGYHIGAKSHSGAMGPGQVIGVARKHISKKVKSDEVQAQLRSAGSPACTALADQIKNDQGGMRENSPCDAINIEKGNPLLNLVYSFLNVSNNEKEIRNFIRKDSRTNNLKNMLNGLDPEEKERVIFGLAVWAHNTGAGGMTASLQELDTNPLFQMKLNSTADAAERYQSIEEILLDCRVSPDLQGCVTLERAEPAKASSAQVVAQVRESVGTVHLFRAAASGGDINRFRETMNYLPKILKVVEANSAKGCLDYYGNDMPATKGHSVGGTDGN